MKLAGLSEQDIAALALGQPLGATKTPAAVETEAEKTARIALEAAAAETGRLATEAAADATRLAAEAAANPAAKGDTEIVAFLKGELATKTTALNDLTTKHTAVEAKLAAAETTHNALLDIARGAVANMRVALGGSAGDSATLTDLAVVGEHKTLSVAFAEKFKVGGVAAVAAEVNKAGAVVPNSQHMAGVKAASTKP